MARPQAGVAVPFLRLLRGDRAAREQFAMPGDRQARSRRSSVPSSRPRAPRGTRNLISRGPVRAVLTTLLFAAAAVGLWLRGPDWSRVATSFGHVDWRWVAVALALNLLSVLLRALCWWIIVRQATTWATAYHTVLSGYSVGLLANAVLPGRVGEVARVAVLQRKAVSLPGLWPTLIGTVVAHRLFDLFPSAGLAVWVIVASRLPRWAFVSLLAVLVLGATALVAAVLVARVPSTAASHQWSGRVRSASRFVQHGLAILRAPRAIAPAAAAQVAGWLCQLLAVWAALAAFGITKPLVAAGLVLVLMNVANLLPLWPGNVGLLQAAIALPLLSYGVAYARGFAFGIGLQAIEASVGIAFGVVFLLREGVSFAFLRDAAEPAPPAPSPERRDGREG